MKKYLSIDIGGTYMKYGVFDHSANILAKGKVRTPDTLEQFEKNLIEITDEFGIEAYGIAISAPGKIDSDQGKVYFGGALPYLDGYDFSQKLQQRYGEKPVAVQNDGKSAALAEWWLGELKNERNAAAIILGTGVGGGIIVNGQLLKGAHFQAGELSFMVNDFTKENENKLVGFDLSAVRMIEKIATILSLEDKTDGLQVFEAIKDKHKEANEIFSEYCTRLAYLILNIQSVIDISKVVIGGGISSQPILVDEIKGAYDKILEDMPLVRDTLTKPEITKAYFENDANLYGALYGLFLSMEENELE